MKIITLILGLFLLPHALSAQGFNQLEKFDCDGADYSNFIVANDTISIIGSFINNNGEEEGLYFQKIDSFGQVITEKTFVHPTKLYWAATRRQGFIKLKNHLGYAILGNFYQKQEGYILRLDEDGNFLSLKEYPKPPTFRTASWMYLKETESGLLVGTTCQLDNYDLTNFLYKMDYDGNIIWSIELGTPVEDFISDIVVKNEDEYIVASVLHLDRSDRKRDFTGAGDKSGITKIYKCIKKPWSNRTKVSNKQIQLHFLFTRYLYKAVHARYSTE